MQLALEARRVNLSNVAGQRAEGDLGGRARLLVAGVADAESPQDRRRRSYGCNYENE